MAGAIINLVLAGVEAGIPLVKSLIEEAKRSGELTSEQAAAFEARMKAAFASDAWKTDEQLKA